MPEPDSHLDVDPAALIASLFEPRPLFTYPRTLLDALLERWEEVAPGLIARVGQELTAAMAADAQGEPGPDDDGVLLATLLLSHRRETAAHPVVMRLLRARTDVVNALLGDAVTEQLNVILTNTLPEGAEANDALLGLTSEPGLDHWCRVAALDAVVYAADDGRITRERAIDALAPLLDVAHPAVAATDDPHGMVSMVTSLLTELRAVEHVDALVAAAEGFVGLLPAISAEEIREALVLPYEQGRERRKLWRARFDDVHAYLGSWYCYQPQSASLGGRRGADGREAATPSRRPAVKRKVLRAKKKQKRQARKKSRGR